jgi:hypothetical protein
LAARKNSQFYHDLLQSSLLLADYEACHRENLAAADQLPNPRHSILYPAYKRLVDMLAAIPLKCDEKWFAVRAHRKKMRDERK